MHKVLPLQSRAGAAIKTAVVATSPLPTEMGSLPGVAALQQMEATGKLLLPEAPSASTRLLDSASVQSNTSDASSAPSSSVGRENDSSDDDGGYRTVDYSDFSSDSDSERGPLFSSADQPEIVTDGNSSLPGRLQRTTGDSRRAQPARRMIPIADPTIKQNIQLPLLGNSRGKRSGSFLLPATAEKAQEWRWMTSLRRVLNPPLVAAAGGLLLGLGPFGAARDNSSPSNCPFDVDEGMDHRSLNSMRTYADLARTFLIKGSAVVMNPCAL
jgi:hypothetical protein